jgi:hypothetical protein
MTKRKFEVGDKFYVLKDFPDIKRGDIVTLVEKLRYMDIDRFEKEDGICTVLNETSVEKITGHPQAENMLLYAQDAKKSETPWQWWEARNRGDEGAWHNIYCHPQWYADKEYRQKPRFIKIGEWEVPEPVKEPPKNGTRYYSPEIESPTLVESYLWENHSFDNTVLNHNILHLDKESATKHAEALIKVSGGIVHKSCGGNNND